MFEQTDDIAGHARAWRALAYLHQFALQWTAEREALEKGVAFAERAQDERELRAMRGGLVNALVWGPMPVVESLERLERMLAEVRSKPLSASIALQGIASLKAMRGEFDEARRLLGTAKSMLTDLGLSFRIATLAGLEPATSWVR